MTARAMELDESVSYDGSDYKVIEDGVYPFKVKAVSIVQFNGSDNIPPCPCAEVVMRVGTGVDSTDVKDRIHLYVNDYGNPNWKIAAFYRAIGYKKHGEEVKMNWNESFLKDKTGWLETKQREFTYNQGTRKGETGINIDVARYIDPEDAPADGKPIVNGGRPAEESWV